MVNGFRYYDSSNHLDSMKETITFGEHPNEFPFPLVKGTTHIGDTPGDSEIFADKCLLQFINQILNEEDIDGKLDMFQGHHAFEATEKHFYEILSTESLTSPDRPPLYNVVSPENSDGSDYTNSSFSRPPLYNVVSPENSDGSDYTNSSVSRPPLYSVVSPENSDGSDYTNSSISRIGAFDVPSSQYDHFSVDINGKFDMFQRHPALEATEKQLYEILSTESLPPLDRPPLYNFVSPENSHGSDYANSSISGIGASDVPSSQYDPISVGYSFNNISNDGARNPLAELPELQFLRGVEEARKFLPSEDKLVIDLEDDVFSLSRGNDLYGVKVEEQERKYPAYGSRGRKNRHSDEFSSEEEMSNKQSAINYSEETLRSEMFDMVLLDRECKSTELRHNDQSKGSSRGRRRGKMQLKSETVDLTTLLLHCAQAVAADDRHNGNELLKQIRQHASPIGDGTHRLALCFADGLEARMAGTGSEMYRTLMANQITATEILMAYKLYIAVCPFKKVSYFFSSEMILKTTEKASAVHIIDFGIYFGFQWPSFLESLSKRHGGPPKIKITGIEIPEPGFRPDGRIKETGRRLAEYARSFGVPFEYHAIAAQWETIRAEDLKIDKDEVLVVSCLYRLKYLADETVEVDCPRDKVLRMIRKLNPTLFIHGIMNGSYNLPFFLTRFRQALFHFSALSDILEATTAREDPQRMCIEKCMFDRDALNLIACEGSDRVERPETYKQWQVRNLRAGLVQIPLDRDIMKKATEKVKSCYHKDFVIDEDSRWLLQGWKGRVLYALSAWTSNNV